MPPTMPFDHTTMNGLGTFPLYRLLSTPVFSYFPFSTVSPPMIMEMTTQPPVPLMQDDGPISKPCSNRNNRGNRSTREIRYRRTQITPYGRADYKVMHIKPCMSTLKKALKVYDPGLGEPTSEILERLVEIYNLQSIEWPSEADKQEIMQAKIDKDLKIEIGLDIGTLPSMQRRGVSIWKSHPMKAARQPSLNGCKSHISC